MLNGEERLLQMHSAIFANLQEPVRQCPPLVLLKPLQSLSDRYGHCGSKAFSCQPSQFMGQTIRILILDVEAHSTILPSLYILLPETDRLSPRPPDRLSGRGQGVACTLRPGAPSA